MTTEGNVNLKSTKNEILDAYHELLKKVQEMKKDQRQQEREAAEKKSLVQQAATHTNDSIIQELAHLKLGVVKSFEQLEEQLLAEHKKLAALQQAITLEEQHLQDVHDIKAQAESLTALILAQQEKKAVYEQEIAERREAFEAEIAEKRTQWKKEQEQVEALRKEQEAENKKQRQREEEEYIYQRELQRQKDKDTYEAEQRALSQALEDKRIALEQEFAEREAAILQQEKELHELREKVQAFPETLAKAVQDAENSITDRLTFKYDYESKLAAKEIEGERKLNQQMVTALEEKVQQLEAHIKQLTDKANQASLQVQDIAVKAIEGASRQRVPMPFVEKASESKVPA
jgi:hypothetical protein